MSTSNRALVEQLIAIGVLKTPRIVEAFQRIDRKDFVPHEYADAAYEDHPLPIARGQTISQPYTVGFMLELLQPQQGQSILDVGSGSGWTTALLAHIVGLSGSVRGVDIVPELVDYGKTNLEKYGFENATIESAGSVVGAPEHAPFDRILVSAAGSDEPHELITQLKTEGTLVIPVNDAILKIHKENGGTTRTETYEGFAFVPLIS